ncbi:MAG: mechanosensitive ion channel [Actinomycetia bacterium]|nr:mechanosensitive ion channel [Actinomycetes bacterium]
MSRTAIVAQSELDELADLVHNGHLKAWDYGRAAIILIVALLVARVARFVVKRGLERRRTDSIVSDLVGRVATYVVVILGFLYALETLGVAIGPLLGALGIAGFALAFALQDVVENFLAGLILQASRPFNASDEIETGDYEGTVNAFDARTITLTTPEGETVRIPSAEVIKQPIVNHTQIGRRRSTVEIGVAYGTDLTMAQRVAIEAVTALDTVHDDPAPEALLFQFGGSSVDIAVRFWHGPTIAEKWQARNDVMAVLDVAFKDNAITIPFPQQTVHFVD